MVASHRASEFMSRIHTFRFHQQVADGFDDVITQQLL